MERPGAAELWQRWDQTGLEEVAPGVYRLPLVLPMDGLRAVNVYAVRSADRLVLLDAGWAIDQAELELVDGLGRLDLGLDDVTDFLVTHAHRDHYTMAAALRRRFGARLMLGEPERVNLDALDRREPWDEVPQAQLLVRAGAPELAASMRTFDAPFNRDDWPMPDVWVDDRAELELGGRRLRAIHTPGHTQGHFVFHDEANQLLFTGDHVLPHITPSIGFEQVPPTSPLRDYLTSLHLLRAMPDAMMLPGHGPVGKSVHERVDELLEHHAERLDATLTAVRRGAGTAHEVARVLTWTGRGRRLEDLDDFNRMLAILETYWHLEVLAERGRVRSSEEPDGRKTYEPEPSAGPLADPQQQVRRDHERGMAMETLCDRFERTVSALGQAVALREDGHDDISWAQFGARAKTLALALADLGVRAGDTVALMTRNTSLFHVLDMAVLQAGGTPFSISGAEPAERVGLFLEVAQCSVVLVDDANLDLARAVARGRPDIVVVVVDGPRAASPEVTLEDVERSAPAATQPAAAQPTGDPESIATLIFTSGSTGTPKAVQLSHRAILSSLDAFDRLAPYGTGDDLFLSYLPLSHIAERFMTYYSAISFGGSIHCVTDPETLYGDVVRVRPTRFFGVPRIYEKLADLAKASQAARAGQPREAALAGVRADLGLDRVRYLGVATAPSSRELLEYLDSVGLPVGDIWGLSEAIMCTANPVGAIRLGTVGLFLDGVEARVAEDGELLVRGRNVFSGYKGDPARTTELVDDDGWVHTGDLGSIDGDGYLSILGRKKELMITATGKNLMPAVIEAAIKDASPLIDHVMSIADGRRFVTALVALDGRELERFAAAKGLSGSFDELARSQEVRDAVQAAVDEANAHLSRPESVRAWSIVENEWRPGSDEITPTMKLRRGEISRKYADVIESLYR